MSKAVLISIGTELFLAREEAARAIQEMEGKKDGV